MAKKKNKPQKNVSKEPTTYISTNSAVVHTRGRFFEGLVTKKFPTRVVMEFERTVYVPKYQRFTKKKTRIHARLPPAFDINVGDYIRIQECRPLSKIIHFMVIEKIKSANPAAPVSTSLGRLEEKK